MSKDCSYEIPQSSPKPVDVPSSLASDMWRGPSSGDADKTMNTLQPSYLVKGFNSENFEILERLVKPSPKPGESGQLAMDDPYKSMLCKTSEKPANPNDITYYKSGQIKSITINDRDQKSVADFSEDGKLQTITNYNPKTGYKLSTAVFREDGSQAVLYVYDEKTGKKGAEFAYGKDGGRTETIYDEKTGMRSAKYVYGKDGSRMTTLYDKDGEIFVSANKSATGKITFNTRPLAYYYLSGEGLFQ